MFVHEGKQRQTRGRIIVIGVTCLISFSAVGFLVLGLQSIRSALAEPTTVGLVIDEAGIPGSYLNWLSYQGLLRAENELGIVSTVYTPTSATEYTSTIQQCVDENNQLCISVGWQLGGATFSVATSHPGTSFAQIDWWPESYPDNLRGIDFDYEEMGYLAGTLAGLMTESDVVGVVGGPQFVPAVVSLVESYQNGAQCANALARTEHTYASSFTDRDQGAALAQEMIAQGADVIFAAGGDTSIGSVLTATQSGAWGIGVDMDFYPTIFDNGAVDGADKLLSSAVKKFDNVVFATISDVISGTFTSGTVVFNLELDGIGLAPFHEADAFVPQSVRAALSDVEAGLINETIDPSDPCREYLFFPLLEKVMMP